MKRYLVFKGDQYYPSGGWADFADSFDTLDDAFIALASWRQDWWHIIDTRPEHEAHAGTFQIVARGSKSDVP